MFPAPIFATTDTMAHAEMVEGYNSNVVQTQDEPGGPAQHHPALFTGIEGDLTFRFTNSRADISGLHLRARGQIYESLDGYPEAPDGTLGVTYGLRYSISPRTTLLGGLGSTLTTLNSARLSDGSLFLLGDPTVLRRTYTVSQADIGALHEISPTWRYRESVGLFLVTTVKESLIPLPSGDAIDHKGIDYVQPHIESDLIHAFDKNNDGDLLVRYQLTYSPFTLDYTDSVSPVKTSWTHLFLVAPGWTHFFSQSLLTITRAGGTISSAPFAESDTKPLIFPTASEEVHYTTEDWQFILTGRYIYGTVNPRVGTGPSLSASGLLSGTPFPQGQLHKLSLLFLGQATKTSILAGPNSSTSLTLFALGTQARYALNTWLGLIAGYDVRYASFTGPGAFPPLFRNVVFVGLSGYTSTDRNTAPVLNTLMAPVNPG